MLFALCCLSYVQNISALCLFFVLLVSSLDLFHLVFKGWFFLQSKVFFNYFLYQHNTKDCFSSSSLSDDPAFIAVCYAWETVALTINIAADVRVLKPTFTSGSSCSMYCWNLDGKIFFKNPLLTWEKNTIIWVWALPFLDICLFQFFSPLECPLILIMCCKEVAVTSCKIFNN